MKSLPYVLLVGLASVLSACSSSQSEYQDIYGKPVSIKNSDNWTVVAYWADWCSSCKAEISLLNELNEQPNIQVVGNYFRSVDKSQLQNISKEVGIAFSVLEQDLQSDFHWDNLVGLPTHYVVSPDNKVYGPYKGRFEVDALSTLMSEAA